MDKQNNQFSYTEKLQRIRLSDAARTRIDERLREFADFHAIRDVERMPAGDRLKDKVSTTTVWTTSFFIKVNRSTMPAFALVAALVIGGGTTLAAENSLPGDLLYPVKISVNENVRSALAVSVDAEAALQAELLAERVAEAAALQAEGKFDGELAARVRTNVAAQADAADQASERVGETVKAEFDNRIKLALDQFNGLLGTSTLLAVQTDGRAADRTLREASTASRQVDKGETTLRYGNSAAGAESLSISADAAVGTMLAIEPIELSTLITSTNERIISLDRVLTRYQREIKADVYTELRASLNEAKTLMARIESESETEARQSVAVASDLAGSIESELSLLGTITIDPQTGAIVEIDFSIIPPKQPEIQPHTVTQPVDRLETSIETRLEDTTGIDLSEVNDINTSADGALNLPL